MVLLLTILQRALEEGAKNESVNSLTTAKGEVEELKSQLYRGPDANYISEILFTELYADADLLVTKIGAFISCLNSSNIRGQKFKERN